MPGFDRELSTTIVHRLAYSPSNASPVPSMSELQGFSKFLQLRGHETAVWERDYM